MSGLVLLDKSFMLLMAEPHSDSDVYVDKVIGGDANKFTCPM